MEASLLALISQARDLISHKNANKAIAVLLKAQAMLETLQTGEVQRLKSLTWKNLGTAYKAAEVWTKALDCFDRALQIEEYTQEPKEQAWLHLNLGSVYCALSKHRQALDHNKAACSLLNTSRHSKSSACLLAVAFHNSADELRHLNESLEAARMLRQGHDIVCPLLGSSHQLTQLLEDSQAWPVLRRVVLTSKALQTPKVERIALKTRNAQRTRQIYMQDITRHATLIKHRPRGNSRLDDISRSMKHKALKSKTFLQATRRSASPSRRLFRPSASQSPPKRLPKAFSVSDKLNQIEEKFAQVNRHLQQFEHQNLELQELVASKSSLASDLAV